MKIIQKPTITIVLTADETTIRERITNRNPNDPDLDKVDRSQKQIKTIVDYAIKYDFSYIEIDTSNRSINEIVDDIINYLKTNKII